MGFSRQEYWSGLPLILRFLYYNKKKPIVLFGCSYTYGLHLSPDQVFSYKLAHQTKRPVYNRAWQGWGIQHMLEQTTHKEVFENIPEPEYIIYTFIDDHFRRLYISHISPYDFLTKDQYLNYELKNEKLIKKTNKNKIKTFISNTYIAKTIREYQLQKFINNQRLSNKKIDFALLHFLESKKNIDNYWKNTKFIVFFYDDTTMNKILASKLEENGFITITSKELTKEDLSNEKYCFDNHPTEEAWDLLTPLIVEKLELK